MSPVISRQSPFLLELKKEHLILEVRTRVWSGVPQAHQAPLHGANHSRRTTEEDLSTALWTIRRQVGFDQRGGDIADTTGPLGRRLLEDILSVSARDGTEGSY